MDIEVVKKGIQNLINDFKTNLIIILYLITKRKVYIVIDIAITIAL